jgi:ethanolamine ammonia-lyase small subunit
MPALHWVALVVVSQHVLLEFQLSHAQAKDAVYQEMDVSYLSEQLATAAAKFSYTK